MRSMVASRRTRRDRSRPSPNMTSSGGGEEHGSFRLPSSARSARCRLRAGRGGRVTISTSWDTTAPNSMSFACRSPARSCGMSPPSSPPDGARRSVGTRSSRTRSIRSTVRCGRSSLPEFRRFQWRGKEIGRARGKGGNDRVRIGSATMKETRSQGRDAAAYLLEERNRQVPFLVSLLRVRRNYEFPGPEWPGFPLPLPLPPPPWFPPAVVGALFELFELLLSAKAAPRGATMSDPAIAAIANSFFIARHSPGLFEFTPQSYARSLANVIQPQGVAPLRLSGIAPPPRGHTPLRPIWASG